MTDVAEENSAGAQPSWAARRKNSEAEKPTNITGGVKECCDGGSKSQARGEDSLAWQKCVGSRKYVSYVLCSQMIYLNAFTGTNECSATLMIFSRTAPPRVRRCFYTAVLQSLRDLMKSHEKSLIFPLLTQIFPTALQLRPAHLRCRLRLQLHNFNVNITHLLLLNPPYMGCGFCHARRQRTVLPGKRNGRQEEGCFFFFLTVSKSP